ncbi:MAG: 3-phosphoshikimate 1-carboxyvinyltransferase [Candidatus Altiarchaeota archaeon]|nr:3-phosphoshikimate 1-carboxyvinyltransferase [Candidatus Altiarchaeota archaeon]
MLLCVKETGELRGAVKIPGSKSYTHRALVTASLGKKSQIRNPLVSSDTLATKKACEALGAKITDRGGDWIVEGVDGVIDFEKDVIDVGNSGTTLRFITPLAALSDKWIRITGDASISGRPMKPLLDSLKGWAEIESSNGFPPIRLRKKKEVVDGRIRVWGNVSSQYISALLLVAPLVGLGIKIDGGLKSRPYVDLTLEVMEKAGVKVESRVGEFYVERQNYGGLDYRVPGDYSSAANILAPCSFIESDVELKNLYRDRQGDRMILDILEKMGVSLRMGADYVRVRNAGSLDAIELDASDTPDIVLPLVAVACFAKGKSVFRNIGHLRFKESDRLKACNEFRKLGARVKVLKDSIEVEGPMKAKPAEMRGFKDHRVVMALACAALKTGGGVSRIDSADMLNVSFPNYLGMMQSLGARMWVE